MDISILVTVSQQAALAYRALRSAGRAATVANNSGLRCELMVVCDRADDATRGFVERFEDYPWRCVEIDAGNLGQAWQAGARAAAGKYVALLDAEHLMSANWLVRAHKAAESAAAPGRLFHPQIGVVFDEENHTRRFGWSEEPQFTPAQLAFGHPWTANLFFRRALLGDASLTLGDDDAAFGHDVTHFIGQQLAAGGSVYPVHETCVFLRKQSYVPGSAAPRALLRPTKVLRPDRWSQPAPLMPATAKLPLVSGKETPALSPTVANEAAPDLSTRPGKPHTLWGKVVREWQRFRRRRLGYRDPLPAPAAAAAPPAETPAWLWNACLEAHAVEPKIFPNAHYLKDCRWPADLKKPAETYRNLCLGCEGPISHVVLLPWLKTGGVDLEALNYIRLIVEESPDNRVAVVTTEPSESTWRHRLPSGVVFVPFGHLAAPLSPDERAHLLATWLVQLQPAVIHNMNSHLAYVVVRDYGRALRQISRLYASVFCEDMTAEGRTVGWAFDRLPECCEHWSGVFADNRRILNVLRDMFGLPEERLHLHYQPIELAKRISTEPQPTLRVLWAGRLDRQKRLDLLAKIAERLVDAPIHFTVYGSTVLDYDRLDLAWNKYSNITYRGPFDGFASLPLDQFDLLLHTAQWEGLPNVLLEALAQGLPVMASAVGGVPELIENDQTGICVAPFDDVDRYCDELRALAADRGKLSRLAEQGRDYIARVHSWEAFRTTLRDLPAYLTPRSQRHRKAA